jgi:hypothetical protein
MTPHASSPEFQPGDPRLIVQWARRYAKSRTISFLVQWVFIVCMVVFIGIAASLTTMAQKAGNDVLVYASAALLALTILALTWFSVSPWGGELVFRITQWLYGREGYVSYAEQTAPDRRQHWAMTALGGGLVVYHLAGALLVSLRILPMDYLQPYSAVYMAPFLAYMIWVQGLGFWAWLWPLCYAMHAVLLLTPGAPVAFPREWRFLDLVVPVFGYGLLAILVGHLYSRYALYKLRTLARCGLDAQEDADGDGGA